MNRLLQLYIIYLTSSFILAKTIAALKNIADSIRGIEMIEPTEEALVLKEKVQNDMPDCLEIQNRGGAI